MKYSDFRKIIDKPYFSASDINLRGIKTFNSQLALWYKKGDIKRLKKSLYVFSERMDQLTPEEVSFRLYEPSYLSLEYALSHYGFIPEMVYAYTCVTTKTTREFDNIYGRFIYHNLKPELFFGYNVIQTRCGKYLLAEPEKALLDYLHLHPYINDRATLEEMRINYDIFNSTINRKKLTAYLEIFNVNKLKRLIELLLDLCSHSAS